MKRKLNFEKLYMFILLCVSVVAGIIICIQWLILRNGAASLDDQLTSKRWAYDDKMASISVYMSSMDNMDGSFVAHQRANIEKALYEQGFNDAHPNGRAYIDAYSTEGKLTITNEKKSADCIAYAVGGDFFIFHPLKLVNGTYFDESEIMDDYIVIDRETAWNVFGGDEVEGKFVYVGETPLKVRGVYDRDDSKLSEYAGNGEPSIFVSYSMYSKLTGYSKPITCYEITLPNPVDNFANNFLDENAVYNKDDVIKIENSKRFSYDSYINVYKERNARSMRTGDIAFPYWENLARAKEDSLMPVAMWQIWEMGILGTIWFVTIVGLIIIHKPTKENFEKLFDAIEQFIIKTKRKIKDKKKDKEKEKEIEEDIEENTEEDIKEETEENTEKDLEKEEEITDDNQS